MNYIHAAVVGLVIGWCLLIGVWFVMGFLHFAEAKN